MQEQIPQLIEWEKGKNDLEFFGQLDTPAVLKFLKENPPDNIKDSRQLTIFDQVIDEAINPIIKKINFPNVNTLIQEMKLELSYSDITYEDLKDNNFIDLLVKNNVITENEKSKIVEFKKAYEVKK